MNRIMAGRIILAATFALALSVGPLFLLAETPYERALRALDQPAQVEVVDTPFKDLLAHLSRQHGVPILILRESYEAGYVLPDQPVTRHFKEVSLRSALNLLLDPLKLDYRVTERGEILIFAAAKSAREERPVSKRQAAAAERHRLLLAKKIVTLEFVDTPFKDVIGWIADEVGVHFVLGAEALDAVKLQPDEQVTINLKNMPLQRALTAFLYPYGLDVELRDEVLLVTQRNLLKPQRPIPEYLKRAAATPVEIELLNPELKDAISECANQANVTIVIDGRVERIDTKVVGPLPKMPLRDALQKMLEPIGLQAKVIDEVLFIVPSKSAK